MSGQGMVPRQTLRRAQMLQVGQVVDMGLGFIRTVVVVSAKRVYFEDKAGIRTWFPLSSVAFSLNNGTWKVL